MYLYLPPFLWYITNFKQENLYRRIRSTLSGNIQLDDKAIINFSYEIAEKANREFSQDEIAIFNKIKEYGPHFFYRPHEEDIVVEPTKDGENKYRKIYVHRPIAKKWKAIYIFLTVRNVSRSIF